MTHVAIARRITRLAAGALFWIEVRRRVDEPNFNVGFGARNLDKPKPKPCL